MKILVVGSSGYIGRPQGGEVVGVRAVGPERIIYGSDHPTLPFGFELGKVVKYAGLNSDQIDLILGKNLTRLLRFEPKPSAPKTMDIMNL